MPHVVVKLWPGKSGGQKQALSDAIVASVNEILEYKEHSVSVGFEEVDPGDWQTAVYDRDIAPKWASLTKRPGYGPGPRR